jgi:hypothetical protein
MFKITKGSGFQMTFENGWTVSVQFSAMSYCDNRNSFFDYESDEVKKECKNAEIAAWDSSGTWYSFECDTVKGYCSTDEVADFILKIKNMPSNEKVVEATDNILSQVKTMQDDHTCLACGNTKCNKAEKSCWKCGAKF